MPKQCEMRIVAADEIESTTMKAQFPSVMATWLALKATLPSQPIMMLVPTKADDSRNICMAIGRPMASSFRTGSRSRRRSEKPRRKGA